MWSKDEVAAFMRHVYTAVGAGTVVAVAFGFMGQEDADKAMTTTVIVGKQANASTSDPEFKALDKLGAEKFWPVDIAYFDETSEAGEDMPDYRISFKLYENGLTRDLEMDYGDFSIHGELVDLAVFEPAASTSCDR